jgi:hypothetical protein
MSLFKPKPRRERGYALPLMMALVATGSTWLIVSAMGDAASQAAADRARNAAVMKQAKEAVVAWVARQVLEKDNDYPELGERNPGRLPCPEAPGYFGTANEGIAAGNCTLPAVGRLPWRTLGLDKLTDAAGEPLWYVVSPGWALASSGSLLTINSASQGQLTVDGSPNAAVALIVAPGRAMNVQSSAGCAPRDQARPTAGAPDLRDYLECDNATSPADAGFVSVGPAASFNDQVLRITVADIMPALEAAIAARIERDIGPVLENVYTVAQSGVGSWYGWSANYPHYPFAVPFSDPGTSNYRGSSSPATYQGLLPMATAAANPGFVSWNPGASSAWHSWSYSGSVNWYDCLTWFSSTELWCEVNYSGRPVFGFWAQAYNVGNSLRAFSPAAALAAGAASLNWYDGYLDYDGSAWIYAEVVLPERAVDGTHWFNLPIGFLADHPMLDPNHSSTGWFVRNQWQRFAYYAVSEGFTPGWNSQCGTPGNPACLTVSDPCPPADPATQKKACKHALLMLVGRPMSGQTRPSSNIADYIDISSNRDGNASFERKPAGATLNDRFATLSAYDEGPPP